ncbi:hypothetical protein [Arthrobacter sp. U41]|uniref:hypothetical protein n=1 Tax=Arthrobacter sp. U41 TaxID=1849032 RepID=UPI0012F8FECD|nr:hypothetical protein [Arthrobacter sp. U41]
MSDLTLREKVASQIKSDNPEFIVKAFAAAAPDNLGAGKVQVAVWRESLAPNQLSLDHNLTVQVLTKVANTLKGEEALDIALDGVLLSIERMPGVLWTNAERAVFDEKYVGYQLTLKIVSPNVYKTLVREEQKAV